jgi:CubicO group peptidase (beta-lactamase class C family)
VERWLSALDSLRHPNSFMLMRNGFVIAEGWWKPYNPETRHQLYSLSKSFVSFACGFAVEEGLLKLDDPITSFFPESLPPDMEPAFRRMTIRHLLSMSSGHSACVLAKMIEEPSGDWTASFFKTHLDFEPGSRFAYNSAATYMVSAALAKVTGLDLLEYLNPRLLRPLGIENAYWDRSPKGVCIGGWGFHLNTSEIANFAQLLLDGGRWKGRQLIPKAYFDQATGFQSDNSMNESPDWKLGYGFQFWRSQHDAFRGDGAFGQYALAVPAVNMALATTSGMRDMQSILTLVWDILLPAAKSAPLPEDPAALKSLREKCASLAIPGLAQGTKAKPRKAVSYEVAPNDAGIGKISFEFSADSCSIVLERGNEKETLRAGFLEASDGVESFYFPTPKKIVAG